MDEVEKELEKAKNTGTLFDCIIAISNAFCYLKKYLVEKYQNNNSINNNSITYKYYQTFVKKGQRCNGELVIQANTIITYENVNNLANFIKNNKQSKFRAFFRQSRISKIEKPLQGAINNLDELKKSLYEVIDSQKIKCKEIYMVDAINNISKIEKPLQDVIKHLVELESLFNKAINDKDINRNNIFNSSKNKVQKTKNTLTNSMTCLTELKELFTAKIDKKNDQVLEIPIQVIEHFYKLDENQKERLKCFLSSNAYFQYGNKNSIYNVFN